MPDNEHNHIRSEEGSNDVRSSHPSENAPATLASNGDHLSRQLQTWLNLPTTREQRRYLESHRELLDIRSDSILRELLAQETEQPEKVRQLRDTLMLLQDARKPGGTEEAIREAYINIYGGFVLDLPPWLEEVEQRLISLLNENRPEETAEERVKLLLAALERSQGDTASPPELLATLQCELLDSWRRHPHTDHKQVLETAISTCQEILHVYTITHYPYQYAKAQNNLGLVYQERVAGGRRENLEQAIICYHEALRVHTLDAFPFVYAATQSNLGLAYGNRIAGEQRENLELAIVCQQEALRVWTLSTLPFYYARAQNNLGIAYIYRIAGERSENLERAIACYHEALRVWTLEISPFEYANAQNNLGIVYQERLVGERRENLERAIACYHEVLRVWTLEAFPFHYAGAQTNLGLGYWQRMAGERRENLEQAIIHQHEALRVWTLEAFPFYYAEAQKNLGFAYQERIVGEPRENLEHALACYHEALRVWTLEAAPSDARDVYLHLAEIEAQRDHWDRVQDTYKVALEAEDLLVILGAGTHGRDAILKEGRDAAIRNGYALHRLGRISEAVVAMERGRARGLAEAMVFGAADPALISDEERRSRYAMVRTALIMAQADLHAPLPQDMDEDTRRRLDLERIAAYRQAKDAFDASVSEIRAAHDPEDFLNAPLDAATILHIAEHIGPGHALVYLAATPWGGVAVAALVPPPESSLRARFVSLDLPEFNETFVNTLIETRLQDGTGRIIGGFALAQRGDGFEQMLQQWNGETFRARARALHTACRKTHQASALDVAAQATLAHRKFAHIAKQPITELSRENLADLSATLDGLFLQRELERCLNSLGKTVLHPLVVWLCKQEVTSLTLIPCGHLAAFPLTAVMLPDGRLFGETLPTSVAPSARSLLHSNLGHSARTGVYALGDPHNNLNWSEAEALTISALARQYALPTEVHVKEHATRDRLLAALGSHSIVDVSCHGTFDTHDFLQSALLLAGGMRVTMAEMLSHQADLRGLRLLLLSACQTALLDLQGARDEMHSLAAAMLQAGARAVLATQWAVDDKATYLLMVRFAQEWFPHIEQEPPAAALARAQSWLRSVTNAELTTWHSTMPVPARMRQLTRTTSSVRQPGQARTHKTAVRWRRIPVRGRYARYPADEAQLIVRFGAEKSNPSDCPYADPYYWAGFQVIGW